MYTTFEVHIIYWIRMTAGRMFSIMGGAVAPGPAVKYLVFSNRTLTGGLETHTQKARALDHRQTPAYGRVQNVKMFLSVNT